MTKLWKGMLGLVAISLLLMTGCATATQTKAANTSNSTASVLPIDYENALDATNQLALGTLDLEETDQAVTEEQASALLPLWQALVGGVAEGDSETNAIVKQIATTMTDAQITGITNMQLTQDDLSAWMQDRGMSMPGNTAGGGGAPEGASENMEAMREKAQDMTEEERTAMREEMMAQMGDDGEMPSGMGRSSGSTGNIYTSVVTLLAEKAGEEMPARSQSDQQPEEEAEAIETPEAEETQEVSAEATPEATPEPTPEAEVEETTGEEEVEAEAEDTTAATTPVVAVAAPQPVATEAVAAEAVAETVTVVSTAALTQVEDTDPGPPFSVTISENSVAENPDYDGGSIYTVSGWVTNDSDDVYVVQAVNVTFYDADGFHGAFYSFGVRGSRGYGEYIWHGAMEAEISCNILGPGESCPFIAAIAASDMGSFLVHTDADVVEWHEPASAQVSNTSISTEGSYLVIRGTVTNSNDYAIENILINGTLFNAAGEMVNFGSTYLSPTLLEAGASAGFEVYVQWENYTRYEVDVQAEGAFS